MNTVIGHQAVKERFRTSIFRDRLPSTFLMVGPEGIGKRTFAIQLARALLCEAGDRNDPLDSCGQCESCQLVDAGTHPDFEFVNKHPDKAFLQIEQFIGDREHRNRAGLCHHLSLSPFRGGRKIAVIDDADFFNQESANCLLKILEEPPPGSILMMLGTSEQKQLSTIRSRSQIIRFQPLSTAEVKSVLETLDLSEITGSVDEMANQSRGSLNILSKYREEGLLEFRQQFLKKLATFEPIEGGFAKELSGFVEQAGREPARRRDRIRQLADDAIEFYSGIANQLSGMPRLQEGALNKLVESTAASWSVSSDYAIR